MSHTDEEFEELQNLNDLYRSAILDSNEAIGWGIEILTKVKSAIDAGQSGALSPDTQYQVKQTLIYLKSRKNDNDQFRKSGDPIPRTFEQYEHP